MRTVSLAFGSFVFGIASTLLFVSSGNHTPPLLQPSASWAQVGIDIAGVEPVVPPLPTNRIMADNSFTGVGQALDGLNCERCKFHNVVLTYAGGAYRLEPIFYRTY